MNHNHSTLKTVIFSLIIIGVAYATTIGIFAGINRWHTATIQSFMNNHCEKLSDAQATHYWYECDQKEVQ